MSAKLDSNSEAESVVSGNTKKQPNKNKHWFFTFNNYTEADIIELQDVFNRFCISWIFQEEIGECGTPHLQGCVKCIDPMRWTEFKLSKKIHWEKLISWTGGSKYCTKDETSNGQIYCSKDLEHVRKRALECRIKTIRKEDFYDWQKYAYEQLKYEADDRLVHWIYSRSGKKGKSAFTKYMVKHENFIFLSNGKSSDIANLIVNQDMSKVRGIIFDLSRCQGNKINFDAIENIKNGMICSMKYEGGIKIFNPIHVMVFSNEAPELDKLSSDRWKVTDIEDFEKFYCIE